MKGEIYPTVVSAMQTMEIEQCHREGRTCLICGVRGSLSEEAVVQQIVKQTSE